MQDNDDFDYQAYARETPPDPSKIHRGPAELERRRAEAALRYQHVRIERENFEQFQQIAANGQSAEQLINQALREWLATDGLKDVLRAEIHAAVQQALAEIQQQAGAASS